MDKVAASTSAEFVDPLNGSLCRIADVLPARRLAFRAVAAGCMFLRTGRFPPPRMDEKKTEPTPPNSATGMQRIAP
jgi:hypothetical protein